MRNYGGVDVAGRRWSGALSNSWWAVTRELCARPTTEMTQEVGGAVSAGLRGRHALVVVTVVALFTGCSSSEPPAPVAPPVGAGIQLPVFEKSCAPQPGPASVVPIRVVRAAIVANVCIGGEGPFPFLVDTGGSTTLVDASLAARLHLALVDGPRTVSSFTCKRQISFAAVSRWSVGNTTLAPQTAEVGTVQSPVLPNLDGVLGSDTLSSFGAVRIDYRQQTVTLGPQSRSASIRRSG